MQMIPNDTTSCTLSHRSLSLSIHDTWTNHTTNISKSQVQYIDGASIKKFTFKFKYPSWRSEGTHSSTLSWWFKTWFFHLTSACLYRDPFDTLHTLGYFSVQLTSSIHCNRKIHIFPSQYHQHGRLFSIAMLFLSCSPSLSLATCRFTCVFRGRARGIAMVAICEASILDAPKISHLSLYDLNPKLS